MNPPAQLIFTKKTANTTKRATHSTTEIVRLGFLRFEYISFIAIIPFELADFP